MSGWISLHRKILEHDLAKHKQPVSKFEAWIIILLEVNYKRNTEVFIKGKKYTCERGQSLNSLETWAKLFNWKISKVRSFFKELEKRQQISTQKSNEEINKITRLTVLNYDTYQDKEQQESNKTDNTRATKLATNNNDNKVNNITNAQNTITFEWFWNTYNKKIDRRKSELRWNRLSNEEKQKIYNTLPNYLKTIKDKQYQKYPSTYLNNKCWLDEIETNLRKLNYV